MSLWKKKGETIGLRQSSTTYPQQIIYRDIVDDKIVTIIETYNYKGDDKLDLEYYIEYQENNFVPASKLWPPKTKKLADQEVKW